MCVCVVLCLYMCKCRAAGISDDIQCVGGLNDPQRPVLSAAPVGNHTSLCSRLIADFYHCTFVSKDLANKVVQSPGPHKTSSRIFGFSLFGGVAALSPEFGAYRPLSFILTSPPPLF